MAWYVYPLIWLAVALNPVVIPFCVLHAWTEPTFPSIKPLTEPLGPLSPVSRIYVDEWTWKPLNKWYGNSEDGVSGQQAYVWNAAGQLVPYSSLFPAGTSKAWIAICWNARNNANNIKRPLRSDYASPVT